MRRRLDAELVRRGMADSRTQARTLIEGHRVLVGGALATKPARQVHASEPVVIEGERSPFVGRGAQKLQHALEEFGLDPAGMRVLDAGASTGGFTDLLIQRGATEVVALDVGHGQLHQRLRSHPQVVVMERTNVRHVGPDQLGHLDAVVADLSFISLTVVMEVLLSSCAPGGWLVLLVKPQFEAGRREVSRGRGVIRDPELWRSAIEGVATRAEALGAEVAAVTPSPLHGADGNVEFLLQLTAGHPGAAHSTGLDRGVSARAGAVIDAAVALVTPDEPATALDGTALDGTALERGSGSP